MSALFISLYLFFRKHRIAFILFLVMILALILVPASKIRFQENISGMSGRAETENTYSRVLRNIKFSDKLIIRFTSGDTAAPADPEALISVAKDFSDSLAVHFDTSFIRSVLGNMNDSTMASNMALMNAHLPVYLDEQDYSRIDSLIRPESVKELLERDYRNLLTPAGFSLKTMILRDPLGIASLAMNKLKSLQAGENFSVQEGFILTKDQKNLLLFITPANPSSETSRNEKLLNGIDVLLAGVGETSHHKIKGDYFGAIAFSVGNARQVKKDIWMTLAVALTLIMMLIGWYFRSWRIPLLGFLPALFGGGLALAVLYLAKGTISSIAMGIGSVILGLIVDYALYIINHFRKKGNMIVVLQEMTVTVLLCSLTTAGAFLCLIFLNSSVLHDLGWFAAISVTGAAFFALVILPQFLSEKDCRQNSTPNLVDRLAGFPFEKNALLVSVVVIAALAAVFFLPKVRFEEDMMVLNFVPDRLQTMEKELGRITDASLKTIYVVSPGKDLDQALKAREKSDPLLQNMKQSGIIRMSTGTQGLLFSDSLQQEKIRCWNTFWTADKRENLLKLVGQESKRLGFKENAFTGFREMLQTEYTALPPAGVADLKTGLLSDYITVTGELAMVTTVIKVEPADTGAVYQTLRKESSIVAFDKQTITHQFVGNVRHDFDLLVRLSMIFVTLLLLLSFGRIETGLATTLPMFLSWLLTLGFMGITGIRFNIFNIIVSSFIFGLGVDYSILMMRGLLYEYKYGSSVISTYKSSIILSASTTLFGVGALFFARHPALNSIAMISVFGIVSVVFVTFTIQPLFVNWFLISRLKKGRYPITMRIVIKTFITWGNIVLVALLQVILGGLIFLLLPVSRKKKQLLFHRLFCVLCKAYIAVTFPTNRKFYNTFHEDFSKPAVIISNHQSLIETPAFLRLHPKIIILTNDWVWNSPLFGPVARMASYFNADHGIDSILDRLQEKVREGYSVLIFPEGHRSTDNQIHRFHRGAFYLAEKLQMDILPVVVFGTGEFLGKGVFWGRPSGLHMKILNRVGPEDLSMGSGYSERSRRFRQLYRKEYAGFMASEGTGYYYRKKLILNYIYKGPVLEWYLRVKMNIEGFYQRYNELIPREGAILDLGCGYGFMAYMLNMNAPGRRITGVDYDEEKIRVAQHAILKNDHFDFICADITSFEFGMQDVILLSDVLHYFSHQKQEELLLRCMERLNPGGMILVRDADSGEEKKHERTKLTEFFSTKVVGFNKTENDKGELYFTSLDTIMEICAKNGMHPEIIRQEKHTSNILVVIRK